MDVTATTGDTVRITLENTGNQPAFDPVVEVTLPADWVYVDGSVSGPLGTTATQALTTLTITTPSGTQIAPGGSLDLTYGLVTSLNTVSGTYAIPYSTKYGSTVGLQDLNSGPDSFPVLVQQGESILEIDPPTQPRAVGDTAEWDITVTNSGLGGLFDITIDEGLLSPTNPAGSLELVSMTQTAPAGLPATGTPPVLTLPYLAPGESFVVRVTAVVAGCTEIENTVATTDRTGVTATDATGSIVLNLTEPLLTYTPANVTLSAAGPVPVSFLVESTGAGDAAAVVLDTTISSAIAVTNVHPDWDYADGTFTYTGNGGIIGSSMSATLSFDVEQTDPCAGGGTGTVVWSPSYTNPCGDPYATPVEFSSIAAPADAPSVTLTQVADVTRLEVGNMSRFVVTLDAENTALIDGDDLIVTNVLPNGVTGVIVTPGAGSISCTGACEGGDTVTWTVPKSAFASGPATLEIDFTAPADPCLGGDFIVNSASVPAMSLAGCDLSDAVSSQILLINNPDMNAGLNFNADSAPLGSFETGAASSDLTRDLGEGEFIGWTSDLSFGGAYPGRWDGSVYEDDYSSVASQALVPGSLTVNVDGNGAVAVPAGSILNSVGSLRIDLSFLEGAGFANDPNVAGHTVEIRYQTTIADAGLGGSATRNLLQRATLRITDGGAGGGICGVGSNFTFGSFFSIARASAAVGVSMPSIVDVCETFPVTFTVSNTTPHLASNIAVTIPTTDAGFDYEYITGQIPVYAGVFNAGNVVYSENGGVNPTFELTPSGDELTGNGSITVQMRRLAGSGTGSSAIRATVDYDDNENAPTTGTTEFQSSGSDSPFLVQEANLLLTVTPDSFTVLGTEVEWTIYVTNSGAGDAVGVTVRDTVPNGLTPDATETDNLNDPAYPVTVNGQLMTWDIGPLASGETVVLRVVTSVAGGGECDAATNQVTASWGCDPMSEQSLTRNAPEILFVDGSLQIAHDTTASIAELCGTGSITLIVKNTGQVPILGVSVEEVLEPLSTGIDLIPGTVTVSTDGGAFAAGPNPTGSGTAADPYRWGPSEISAFAELAPFGDTPNEIRIHFDISASETANTDSAPVVASGTGTILCGESVDSPGTPFSLPIARPNIRVAVSGKNNTAGDTSFAQTVYGGDGDAVEWSVEIRNSGDGVARNVRLESAVPASGGVSRMISGPGFSDVAYTSGSLLSLPDIAAGATVTYIISENLGSNCVDEQTIATVTWGCQNNGASSASNLSSPTNNTDDADLLMTPDFDGVNLSQSFSALPGGRAEVTITASNQGGTAQNMTISGTLPASVEVDTSFTPTFTTAGDVTAMTPDLSILAAPSFDLTGELRGTDEVVITFRVLPVAGFDTSSDPLVNPETTGNGEDPSLPASGTSEFTIDYESTCGDTDSEIDLDTLDPATPDIDIEVSPAALVVTDGTEYVFDFTLTNNGDPDSVADAAEFLATIGAGWTGVTIEVVTPGTGGSAGTCSGGCTAAQIGSLAAGQSAVVRVTATANDNGSPLSIVGRVEGSLLDDAGTDTGDDYSLDESKPRVSGASIAKTRLSTSEGGSDDADVLVGEEATFLLRARWFGGESVSSTTVRDTLPAGLGYVSHAATVNNDVTISGVSGNTPVESGVIDFTLDTIAGEGTFEVEVVARILNIAGNSDGQDLVNNAGLQFDVLGETYASDNAADSLSGDTTSSALHSDQTLTVRVPDVSIAKTVRNVSRSEATFAESTNAQAGEILEYQVVLENTGSAPLYDISVNNVAGATSLLVIDGASDGVDNDGDTTTDSGDAEGLFTFGAAGSVLFNEANTMRPAGSPSSTLAVLDPGETITLLYRVSVDGSASPNDTIENDADITSSTLSGASGGQSSSPGTPGDADGERVLTDSDPASVVTDDIDLMKLIDAHSVSEGVEDDVVIGEQVRFSIEVVLPAGTAPDLAVLDALPEGLALVALPTVDIGSAISGGQPTITPSGSSLPASGDPLDIRFDFGTRTVASGPAADRTIGITYLTQVRNIASNIAAATLVNNASFSFSGSSANLAPVTLTIREPELSVTKTASPQINTDAGDIVTITVEINESGSRTAHDLNIIESLPAGTEYVTGSTVSIAGPSIGEPDATATTLTWGRSQATPADIDVSSDGTMRFSFQIRLLDSVEPGAELTSETGIDWTSLEGDPGPNLSVAVGTPGSDLGERTGSGGTNAYADDADVTLTLNSDYALTKSAGSGTLPGGEFRIGDIIEYTVLVDVREGTTPVAQLRDTLDAGLEFSETVSISPATTEDGFTYTIASQPSADDTGTIVWDFGTLVNAGDADATNDRLTVVYRARVTDTGGLPPSPTNDTLDNSAVWAYQDADAADQETAPDSVTITVLQPELTIAKSLASGQDTVIDADEPVRFTLTISNTGHAPAYNIAITDTLPAGMRDTAPTIVQASIDGVPITLADPSYSPSTGVLGWVLPDATDLGPGLDLVITYEATTDDDIGGGQTLENSASIASFASKPASDSPERRVYAGVGPESAGVTTTTPDATIGTTKAVSPDTGNIGDTVVFTLTAPENTVGVSLWDARFTDTLPEGLRVISVATNAADLGVGVTDNTVDDTVDVVFDRIPADQQGVVTVSAVIENIAATDATDTIDNTAAFEWANSDGATPEPSIDTNTVDVTITEPDLQIDLTLAGTVQQDPDAGLQAGDEVIYTFTVTNTGDGAAHDLAFRALIDELLISPVVDANPDNPGAPTDDGSTSGTRQWSWTIDGPVAPGGTYAFDVTFTIDAAASPLQTLDATAELDWTSIAGVSADERDGSGGFNDYTAADSTPVSITLSSVELTKTLDEPSDGLVAIGEEATYLLQYEPGQGTATTVRIVDTLPAGTEFISTQIRSQMSLESTAGGPVTITSQPAAGDTGPIEIGLGDIRATASDAVIELLVTIRVLDAGTNIDAADLVNNASVLFDNPDSPGDDATVPATAPAVITIVEPNLVLALDGPATIASGQPASFIATIFNTGTSDAHQPAATIRLPEGMRDADPLSTDFTVEIAGGRTLTLASGTDFITTYDDATGDLVVTLISMQAFLAVGELAMIMFDARLDLDEPDGQNFDLLGTVTDYASAPTVSTPEVVRSYETAFGAGTVGTSNGDTGDDPTDDHRVETLSPIIMVTKSVDTTTAMPSDTLSYTIMVTNSGTSPALDVTLDDSLAPQFEPGTLQLVSVTPTPMSTVIDPTGGDNATGRLQISGVDLPIGDSLEVVFTVELQNVLPGGTDVLNTASATVSGFSDPFISDSTNPADDDGVDSGNDASDPDDDDPVRTVIESAPVIGLTKSASDLDGSPLNPDDVIEYTITTTNSGNEHAVGVTLTDRIPAGTEYVAGSTTLNGVAVADISGTAPFVDGISINAPGDPAEQISVGQTAVVIFRARVSSNIGSGVIIENQAALNFAGEGSGAANPVLSDDPSTPAADDPTRLTVGDEPALVVSKSAEDLNGSPLSAGDRIRYTIDVSNVGPVAATNVVVSDDVPADLTLVSGSILFDEDGPDGGDAPTPLADPGGSNPVMATVASLAPGVTARLIFDADVNAGTPDSTIIVNQAMAAGDGLPNTNSDADGNASNGDQPTTLVVGTGPSLVLTKSVIDLNGGSVQANDELEYTLTITNRGQADATGVTITDTVPPVGTSYSTGTTLLDGSTVADTGSDSALNTGVLIGTIQPGQSNQIRFRVRVQSGLEAGTRIENQASFTADAGLAGVSDSPVSDGAESGNAPGDPDDDDPTVISVGGSQGSSSVRGTVYRDTDHDRMRDPFEPTLNGWTVELLLDGVVVESTATDGNGGYTFNGLVPGDGYGLRFRHPETGTPWGTPVTDEPGAQVSPEGILNLSLPDGLLIVEQDLPLDPSGVFYNSITRQPIPNVRVRLTGPPGFDPAIHLPPGQFNQVTGSDGFYRFDLLAGFPPGEYCIEPDIPAGLSPVFPSGLIPPEPGALDPTGLPDPLEVLPFDTAPQLGDSTMYYICFELASGDPDVVNNHIALDPVLEGALVISKTTPRKTVSRGELIPYTIRVRNTLSATVPNFELVDTLPPGFKFVDGSATLGGVPVVPTVSGRTVTWPGLTIAPDAEFEATILAVVGSGVGFGTFNNEVIALDQASGRAVSNRAFASVEVVPDPEFDCTDIIGKVFDDKNGNGYQDEGEPGLPNVRLATVRGLLVTTDAFGRYHIACAEIPNEARGTTFVLKVDERTLPTGYRMVTENPAVVRLTRGKAMKVNFGARIHRVVRVEISGDSFEDGGSDLLPERDADLDLILRAIADEPSILRLVYISGSATDGMSKRRLRAVERRVRRLWSTEYDRYRLQIETEHLRTAEPVSPQPISDIVSGVAPVERRAVLPVFSGVETAESTDDQTDDNRRTANASRVATEPAPVNTESVREGTATQVAAGSEQPLSINIDGLTYRIGEDQLDGAIGGPASGPAATRRDDITLAESAVIIQADELAFEPALNVSHWPTAAVRGEPLLFKVHTNYTPWIDRVNVLLLDPSDPDASNPIAVIPTDAGGMAEWTVPERDALAQTELLIVAQAHGIGGGIDTTRPQSVRVDMSGNDGSNPDSELVLNAGFGENRLAEHTIATAGASVTVSGTQVPDGTDVLVMGRPVPVDTDGAFAVQMLIPDGTHTVEVTFVDTIQQSEQTMTRDLYVAEDSWFYVGLAELTIGGNSGSGPARLLDADGDFDDDIFVKGRGALYLKGKVKGDWLLTASIDTDEEDIEDIFSNLNEKAPRQLLRRLDADRFYPVYGDDSTTIDDAPTQTDFYVRLERRDSTILWGNFHTGLRDTDLAQVDRGLYGGQAKLRSDRKTSFGEHETEIDLFVATPETVNAREEFRGTGGSLYYLRNQDITIGSERVRIEVRDEQSGLVLESTLLQPYDDYDLNYVQGRILLTSPLASTADDGQVVQSGELSGNPVYLVVNYEFTPVDIESDEVVAGGRVSRWLNDRVKVGATISQQEQTGGDQTLYGGDITIRVGPGTHIKAEIAHTDGLGVGEESSFNGGFTFNGIPQPLAPDTEASAFRVEATAELAELTDGKSEGKISAYIQDREAGFSAPGQLAVTDTTQYGARADLKLSDTTKLVLEFDRLEQAGGLETTEVSGQIEINRENGGYAIIGAEHDQIDGSAIGALTSTRAGDRTDVAIELGRKDSEDRKAYIFGQATLALSGDRRHNNRYGAGIKFKASERLTLGGEVSGGNGGVGATFDSTFKVDDLTDTYLALQLDPDRSDTGLRSRSSSLVGGVKKRFGDIGNVFAEERLISQGRQSGRTHAFGLDLAPFERWSFGLQGEFGTIEDDLSGELDRSSISATIQYSAEKLKAGLTLEWREDTGPNDDRVSFLLRNNVKVQIDPDWRLLWKLNLARTNDRSGTFFDGDFTEAIIGFAYRPTEDDRLNLLFKYTFYENVPTDGQIDLNGLSRRYSQRSHVLSADATYDLSERFTVGGKIALRSGEIRDLELQGPWFRNTSLLLIGRADIHITHEWDALFEGRYLSNSAAGDSRGGILLGVYRHINENIRFGVGYNFTDFSDDITDLSYDSHGWFINVTAAF